MAAFETTVGFVEELRLGNKGMVITVKRDQDILGHLMVGKATLHWFEKNAKTSAHKISWEDMIEHVKKQPKAPNKRP